ncbi:hypothetical protein [Parafrankia sp. EUN1f]|uniref:hypothetical protein n=1 Tax=Parafrankia sp. EUN1f TaxID=102897 RepID=UPI0005689F72|nr:hypothetical protein [Parafrankia sp. EUN1f]
MRHIRAHIAPVTMAAVMTACGLVAGCGRAPDTKATALPPRVSAPATLAADGTVPWVDEPAADSKFTRAARPRRTITTDRHCQASDLAAVLPAWQDRTPHVDPNADDQESRAIRRTGPYGLMVSLGDAAREAVNTRSTYRLNTRPVSVLAAKASQDFRFRVTLPAAITQGRELSVSWQPGGPEMEPAGTYASFTVTAR